MRRAFLAFLGFCSSLLSLGAARPPACSDLVECEGNATFGGSSPPTVSRRCPGQPECSGHGRCQRPSSSASQGEASCKCAEGFFGRDCSRRQRDCTKLRSCADCQHKANTKFCGWCADSRYCMPKHIHKMLSHKGKACSAWMEDTCPRNTSIAHGVDSLGYSVLEEWGDEKSVALAEALVAIIDSAGGEGTSGTLGTFLMIMIIGGVALCSVRERRAAERRRRFEAFMAAEEAETLHGGAGSLGSPNAWMSPHCRKLGPTWSETAGARESALADALGTVAPRPASSTRSPKGALTASAAPTDQPHVASQSSPEPGSDMPDVLVSVPATPEDDEKLRQSMRDAARRDIEERKERRRAAAEEARNEALRVERAEAEERARAQLQAKALGMAQTETISLPLGTIANLSGHPGQAVQQQHVPPIASASPPVASSDGDVTRSAEPSLAPSSTPVPSVPPLRATEVAKRASSHPTAQSAGRPEAASLAQAEAEFLDALDDL